MGFIEEIAISVQKYASLYDIKVHSPIIAQACLETGYGKSGKTKFHNYHGLKYKKNRVQCHNGFFEDGGWEEETDGQIIQLPTDTAWYSFENMDIGVLGYFQFLNSSSRYDGVKNVSDPKTYISTLKADGYATDSEYVSKIMKIIEDNDLTKYDEEEEVAKLKIVIDAGHGLYTSGKRCMKSLDTNETREWVLNSRIAEYLEALLVNSNCEVLRVDDRTGKSDISLSKRRSLSNTFGADVYISIHHNAGVSGGASGGTVLYYYSSSSDRPKQAQALYNKIVENTGLIGNRSSKVIKKGFYVLKCNAPSFLIENGFMDSSVDVPIILTDDHAQKTAQGIFEWLQSSFHLEVNQVEDVEESPAPIIEEEKKYITKVQLYKLIEKLIEELNITIV